MQKLPVMSGILTGTSGHWGQNQIHQSKKYNNNELFKEIHTDGV